MLGSLGSVELSQDFACRRYVAGLMDQAWDLPWVPRSFGFILVKAI